MPDTDDKAARQRLGRLLMQARVAQGLKDRNRALFARETGINERLLQDIETGYRGGYSYTTKLAIESAYNWAPGSIDAVMAGGLPTPATASGFTPQTERDIVRGLEILNQRQSEAEEDTPRDDGNGRAANGA